jgi:hypothetical protein
MYVISILLGWDGLGLVSYLFVIFYQNVFTGRCVRMYYTSVLTIWICLVTNSVYLVSVTDFSGRGKSSLRLYLCSD